MDNENSKINQFTQLLSDSLVLLFIRAHGFPIPFFIAHSNLSFAYIVN